MLGLKVLKLVHHKVEVLVANGRLVQHIITVVMLVKLLAELLNTLYLVHDSFFYWLQIYYFFLYEPKKIVILHPLCG